MESKSVNQTKFNVSIIHMTAQKTSSKQRRDRFGISDSNPNSEKEESISLYKYHTTTTDFLLSVAATIVCLLLII